MRSYQSGIKLTGNDIKLIKELSKFCVTISFGNGSYGEQYQREICVWYPNSNQPPIASGNNVSDVLEFALGRIIELHN